MNPYETLGLSNESSDAEVRQAFKKMARKVHPDRAGGSEAEMAKVSQARDILLDPSRKARFDKLGSTSNGGMTIEEETLLILGNMFSEALSSISVNEFITWPQVFQVILRQVASGYSKAIDSQSKHPAQLRRAREVMKRIKNCDPKLKEIFEKRLIDLERSIAKINQQVEVGNLMLKLLQTIEFQ